MALPTSTNNVTVRKLSSTLDSYNTKVNTKLGGKADKVTSATNNNFAALDANGNLKDSGHKHSDYASSSQGSKADSAIQGVKVNGTALTPDTNKVVDITKSGLGLGNVTNDAQVKRSEMGVANGVATLDSSGKIPTSQIPGSYDDVRNGYYYDGEFYSDAEHTSQMSHVDDILYVDIPSNLPYRWTGTNFVKTGSDLALGETSTTAYRGDRGKAAYEHSLISSGNPHNVTKSDVGLGSVVNTGDSATPVSGGTTKFTTGGAYTELAKKADKTSTVTNVAWDSTNKKLTKTVNGTTSDVVTISTIKTALQLTKNDVGLGNVNNTSDATKKTNFTGSVASGDTGFPTGDDVYTAISNNGKGIEFVTYEETSYSEISNIISAGKLPVLKIIVTQSGGTVIGYLYGELVNYDLSSNYTFVIINQTQRILCTCTSSGWSTTTKNLEFSNNKVSSWSSTTTDTNYPSEKLVKDSLDGKVDKVSGKGLSTNDYTTAEKNKLAGIESGAEVNQNAFGNVKVGSTTVAADAKTDTLEFVASGSVTITPDATNDKITISSTDQSVTAVGNHYAPIEDSSAEKDASGGSASQLPTSSSGNLVQVVTGIKMDAKGHVTGVVSKGLWSPDNNTTYTNPKLGKGYASSTAGTSPAFTAAISNYTLDGGNGGFISVKFSADVPANATLNVNSTGAKNIYWKNVSITAGVIQSGDTALLMYDGNRYQLLGTDRSCQEMTDTEVTDLVNALT